MRHAPCAAAPRPLHPRARLRGALRGWRPRRRRPDGLARRRLAPSATRAVAADSSVDITEDNRRTCGARTRLTRLLPREPCSPRPSSLVCLSFCLALGDHPAVLTLNPQRSLAAAGTSSSQMPLSVTSPLGRHVTSRRPPRHLWAAPPRRPPSQLPGALAQALAKPLPRRPPRSASPSATSLARAPCRSC